MAPFVNSNERRNTVSKERSINYWTSTKETEPQSQRQSSFQSWQTVINLNILNGTYTGWRRYSNTYANLFWIYAICAIYFTRIYRLCWHILYDIRHDRIIVIIAEKFETNWKVCVEDTRYLSQTYSSQRSQNYSNSPSIVFLFIFYQVCVCDKRLVTCTCIYVCGLVCNDISESYYISKAITRNIFIQKSSLR